MRLNLDMLSELLLGGPVSMDANCLLNCISFTLKKQCKLITDLERQKYRYNWYVGVCQPINCKTHALLVCLVRLSTNLLL